MRKRAKGNGFTLNAIAGTYVVMLGIDITDASKRKNLLGFAVHRTDHTENEQYWLSGYKTFEAVNPNPSPGSLVSTREAPVQSLLWSDYTAKPGHKYTYSIVPVTGAPKNLVEGKRVNVTIATENEDDGKHAVFFNRGVIGSEAYARKFGNMRPDKVQDNAAYAWLSRGLEEAMIAFIAQAKGKRFSLRASVYEFDWMPVLKAFGAASRRGADIKIVYDHRKPEPGATTDKAARKAGITKLMKKRQTNKSYLSHNKFIILLKDNKPIEVWTGSTNFTESGIFGQSNVGHIVRDANIANDYLRYWEQLYADKAAPALRKSDVTETPDPKGPPGPQSTTAYFSPRETLALLDWYGNRLAAAQEAACFTAAFGVNQIFAKVLQKPKAYPRYILLEKPDRNQKGLQRDPNVQISVGTTLTIQAAQELERWLGEFKNPLGKWVLYVHTKYMLIDPLGPSPVVISGSANFSEASTDKNDENMLVIRGNSRVADIYFGEFMRLFDHFRFRDVMNRLAAKPGSKIRNSAFLKPDDSWLKPYFTRGTYKSLQRKLFA